MKEINPDVQGISSDEEDTEKRMLQQILKQQYQNLQSLNEQAPDPNSVQDLPGKTESKPAIRHAKRKFTALKCNVYYKNQTWKKQQIHNNRFNRNGSASSFANRDTRHHLTPSSGYICHICGNSDHLIKNCPHATKTKTLRRIKPATGLPRSWLTPVSNEDPVSLDCDVYSLPDGTYAVLKKQITSTMIPVKTRIAERYGTVSASNLSEEFLCPLCHYLFQNACLTPCCGETYCRECLLNLKEKNGKVTCPGCSTIIEDDCELITNKTLQDSVYAILGLTEAETSNKVVHVKKKECAIQTIQKTESSCSVKPLGQRLTN